MSPRRFRVGVISGNWGMSAHLPAWRANGAEVAAVCTAHEETARSAAARYGIERAYWNYPDLVADPTLDIVDVGTRPDLRSGMVRAALAAGKHVFAAANFAADLDGARKMRDAARAAGTVCLLDSTLVAIPAHRRMRSMIAAGEIGRPVSVSARLQIGLFNGPDPIGARWRWFGVKRHGASAMRNLGTHSLHSLIDLLGPIAEVAAHEAYAQAEWRLPDGSTQRPEVADTAQLLLRFANGTIGTLDLGWANPALAGWHLQVNGEHATLRAEDAGAWFPTSHGVQLSIGREAQVFEPVEIDEGAPDLSEGAPPQATDIARMLAGFIDAVKGCSSAPQPDFERAFHVESVLDAARRSIKERRWVVVEQT